MIPLEKYLNEHLAGSAAALSLIDTLISEHPAERGFYKNLKDSITRNRNMLIEIISLAKFSRKSWLETFGKAGSAVAQWRLKQRGLHPGELGLVEALEALGMGIQGQLLLWNSLLAVSPHIPEWQRIDFQSLINSAEEQQCRVEAHRISAVQNAFVPLGRERHRMAVSTAQITPSRR